MEFGVLLDISDMNSGVIIYGVSMIWICIGTFIMGEWSLVILEISDMNSGAVIYGRLGYRREKLVFNDLG